MEGASRHLMNSAVSLKGTLVDLLALTGAQTFRGEGEEPREEREYWAEGHPSQALTVLIYQLFRMVETVYFPFLDKLKVSLENVNQIRFWAHWKLSLLAFTRI